MVHYNVMYYRVLEKVRYAERSACGDQQNRE